MNIVVRGFAVRCSWIPDQVRDDVPSNTLGTWSGSSLARKPMRPTSFVSRRPASPCAYTPHKAAVSACAPPPHARRRRAPPPRRQAADDAGEHVARAGGSEADAATLEAEGAAARGG